jgi:tRNA(Ile2) C34 agmatinyltransferase TiaS
MAKELVAKRLWQWLGVHLGWLCPECQGKLKHVGRVWYCSKCNKEYEDSL